MRTGQQLEALRVLLGGVHRDLRVLVVKAKVAPSPSVSSASYDAYEKTLDGIEARLGRMKTAFRHLSLQAPEFHGKRQDPFKAKQRANALQHHVTSVDELLGACFDLLAELLAPDKSLVIKNTLDLGSKLEKFAKMLETEVGMPDGPSFEPALPKGDAGPGLSAIVAVMLIAVAAIKKRKRS
jgi:hypothetical protein